MSTAMSKNDDLHEKLKALILHEIGLVDLKTEPYRLISENIFLKTKNYISQNTVKRYFEFGGSDLLFSFFVLDSLAQYVGYECWSEFYQSVTV